MPALVQAITEGMEILSGVSSLEDLAYALECVLLCLGAWWFLFFHGFGLRLLIV